MTRTLIGPDAVPFMFLFVSATAIAADAEGGPETSITVTGYYYAMRDQSDYGVGVTSLNRGALHLEARYNYEANRSASLFAGWNFAGGESVTFQVTPLIGGLFGEPYRLARTATADLEVPAGAEIVIEGEILAGTREPEGPFGEFTGYASYRSTQNVFVAHRIRMRADAMYHSVVSGMSRDHIQVSCITREGEILNALKRNLPNVRAVHVPHTTCGAFMAFISMKKTADGEPQMAMMATFGTELYTKQVIVVDDDVDIFDMNDVLWAIATRVRAEKDIILIPGAKGAILDPISDPETFTLTKMGIDATRPLGRDFAERLVIEEADRARARAILAGAGIEL